MNNKVRRIPNVEQPITGTWLIPEQCENCTFRFKKYFVMNDEKIACDEKDGWKKDCCNAFPYPQSKPSEVMHNTGKCPYYEKEG